jgi:hypothetical protein
VYRNCIFCSAAFGSNEALESFPVGRQLAFDAWKGRLWAVCPVCSRWNLAPIEERWESVEAAEKLFRDARLRVQSENVGMARLPDGTRLVRIGSALPGEMAAWRYGRQLRRRRQRYFLAGAGGAAASLALYGGITAIGMGFGTLMVAATFIESARQQRVIHRVSAAADSARTAVIRLWHLEGISMYAAPGSDEVEVHVRDAHRKRPNTLDGKIRRHSTDVLVVRGDEARSLLSRAMVHVNRSGADERRLDEATRILTEAGSADHVLRDAAFNLAALGSRAGEKPSVIAPANALALEMALNEASERRALEGELVALEAAWREAEEIAAIADALPGGAALHRLIRTVRG